MIFKDRMKRIITSFLAISVVLGTSTILCDYTRKVQNNTVKSFYCEPQDSLDYVIIGASAAQCDIFPAVIWKEHGIAGHSLCLDGLDSRLYVSMLKEVLKTQRNAVIIVDMDGFTGDHEEDYYGPTDFWLHTMKHNKNWFDLVKQQNFENQLECFIPVIKYHKKLLVISTVYNSLKDKINYGIKKRPNPMRGANNLANEIRISEDERNHLVNYNYLSNATESLTELNEKYFVEFLDYCKNNNLKNVLFVNCPKGYFDNETFENKDKVSKRTNYCKKIISDYGYDVYDYFCDENGANLGSNDYCDTAHLNNKGATKFSIYFGNYLSNKYEFNGIRTQENIEYWDSATEIAYSNNSFETS